jgi:hypothetical protein
LRQASKAVEFFFKKSNKMIQANVNKAPTIEEKSGESFLNGQPFEWDLREIEANHFHPKDNKSYRAEILSADLRPRRFS